MVKTPHFSAGGAGSIPGQGAKIPHAEGRGQKKNKTKLLLHMKLHMEVQYVKQIKMELL